MLLDPNSRAIFDKDTMHYCPRPKCNGRWYHRSCLVNRGYVERLPTAFAGDRSVRFLAVNPDANEIESTFKQFVARRLPPEDASSYKSEPVPLSSPNHPLSSLLESLHLPMELIQAAAQPIIRRPSMGVFSIAGNVKEVVLARRLVYQKLNGAEQILDKINGVQELDSGSASLDIWNTLSDASILASPYPPYWKRLAQHGLQDILHDRNLSPPIICPQCGSPI